MAVILTQSIPSEDRTDYKRSCQIATTSKGVDYVRKRFPWRMKKMQADNYGVSASQKVQRGRFIYVRDKYATLSAADKARWAAANPEWHSYLFGYNFFMLEGLMGGGLPDKPQMIKSIQVKKELVPTTGTKSYAITTVDPNKVVVLIQGNSYIADKVHHYDGTMPDNSDEIVNLSPNIDPDIAEVIIKGAGGYMEIGDGAGAGKWGDIFLSTISATRIVLHLQQLESVDEFGYTLEIIEHKAQTIYPVLVSVSANAVVIDWAKVPSISAYVSITVVEYI